MITVTGGIKGGCGKTTLATNLCVMRSRAEQKVLLVDADEQKSAFDWASQREALGIETKWATIQLSGKTLHSQLKKMIEDYDDIIIDVGGRDTTSQRSALVIADICLFPFKPKSFDMWTLNSVNNMIQAILPINPKLKVIAVINQADSRGTDNKEAIEMIKAIEDFICLDCILGNRKAFSNAAAEGLGVVELKKQDSKAIQEIQSVYSYLYAR